MKTRPIEPNPFHGLLLALISAIALHGLVLSYLQLQRPKVAASPGLQSRDNTPELLQFSREPVPLTQLDLLPLPKARILPPPPVPMAVKSSEAKQKLQGRIAAKPVIQVGKKVKPSGVRTSVIPPSTPEGFKQLDDALETMRQFQRQFTLPSARFEDHPKTLSGLVPAQQETYNNLWAQARPQPGRSVPKPNPLAPLPLEIRSIPLQQVQTKELPIRHQQFVVINDRVALFWLEGSRLWIVQSALSTSSSPVPDSPSKTRPDG